MWTREESKIHRYNMWIEPPLKDPESFIRIANKRNKENTSVIKGVLNNLVNTVIELDKQNMYVPHLNDTKIKIINYKKTDSNLTDVNLDVYLSDPKYDFFMTTCPSG